MSRTSIRVLAVLAATTLASTALAACDGPSAGSGDLLANLESGQVTSGTKYDQPGLGLHNPDGTMSGLDVDAAEYVVNQIAETNGWAAPEITWRETPPPSARP